MDVSFVLGLALSALIGLSLGLVGGGGSIVTVPVLVYLLHVEPHPATGMSLAIVGATSLFGAGLHYRNRNVNLRAGLLFAAAGILGAYYGTRLTYLLSPPALMLALATVMLIVSTRMVWSGGQPAEPVPGKLRLERLLPAGLAVGALTGFLGVGGGLLIVPALVLFAGIGMKEAVGTSLLVIAINCAAGLVGHLERTTFNWRLTALLTAIALVGALAGTRFAHAANPETLRKIFAVFVLAAALFLMARNLPLVF